MKKISFFLMFAMLISLFMFVGTPVRASDITSGLTPPEIVPTEVAPCINGFHYESEKGWGNARYPNGNLMFRGQAWQCIHCYEGLITEGNPTYYYPQIIGKYVTAGYSEPIPSGSLTIYANGYNYQGSTHLPGYRFIN